jgi:hypothetical protein
LIFQQFSCPAVVPPDEEDEGMWYVVNENMDSLFGVENCKKNVKSGKFGIEVVLEYLKKLVSTPLGMLMSYLPPSFSAFMIALKVCLSSFKHSFYVIADDSDVCFANDGTESGGVLPKGSLTELFSNLNAPKSNSQLSKPASSAHKSAYGSLKPTSSVPKSSRLSKPSSSAPKSTHGSSKPASSIPKSSSTSTTASRV